MLRSFHPVFDCLVLAAGFSIVFCPSWLGADEVPSRQEDVVSRQSVAAFKPLLQEWKAALSRLRAVRQEYQQTGDEKQREQLQAEFEALLAKGRALIPRLDQAGRAAYAAAPNEDPELTRFLFKMAKDALAGDRYDAALDLAQLLVEEKSGIAEAYYVAGVAAFVRNDYDKAEAYLETAKQRGVLGPTGSQFLGWIDECRLLWAEEQKLREQQAGSLPLVKLATTKGDVLVELFEKEAPGTVGNFIYLVQEGFFDGLTFHEVVSGRWAGSGCPAGDGTGGPGYKIYCECYQDDYRNHFRGSLSMDTGGNRDTGGSRFFINFVPALDWNGRNTVFGRVLEGMDVLASLQRTDAAGGSAAERDRIIKATIVKKQTGKKYLPVKVKE